MLIMTFWAEAKFGSTIKTVVIRITITDTGALRSDRMGNRIAQQCLCLKFINKTASDV